MVSTGASAHAIVTDKVPAEKVKQRVMVILQPELNINTEIQKRGAYQPHRADNENRFTITLSHPIPAQKRFMMMLKKEAEIIGMPIPPPTKKAVNHNWNRMTF